MATLNCLVRNANTWLIHGNSLSLEAWRGYHVRRTPFGGELYRLCKEDCERILRLPFTKAESTTALASPETVAAVHDPSPEVRATLDEVSEQFTVHKGARETSASESACGHGGRSRAHRGGRKCLNAPIGAFFEGLQP